MFKIIGNPFIDTGARIISFLAHKPLADVTTPDLRKIVFEDQIAGLKLAALLPKMKSLYQVFLNPPIDPKYDKKEPTSQKYYLHLMGTLIQACESPPAGATESVCDMCGDTYCDQFAQMMNRSKSHAGRKTTKNVWIGREIFPLIGSMANDSQTFSQARHHPQICPQCLLCAQFLPLLAIKFAGKLVLFHSTVLALSDRLVHAFMKDLLQQFETLNAETIDLHETNLQAILDKIPDEYYDHGFSLILHLYTNFGAKPDYEKKILPEAYLSNIRQLRVHTESFNHCLAYKSKKGITPSFYDSILNKLEHMAIYGEPVTVKFFDTYLTKVLDYSENILAGYKVIAQFLTDIIDDDEKKILGKESLKDEEKNFWFIVKKKLREKARQGLWNSPKHLALFRDEGLQLHYSNQALRIIHFYYKKVLAGQPLEGKNFTPLGQLPREYLHVQRAIKSLEEVSLPVIRKFIKQGEIRFTDYANLVYLDDRWAAHQRNLLELLQLDTGKILEESLFSELLPKQFFPLASEINLVVQAYITHYHEKGKNSAEIYKFSIKPFLFTEMEWSGFTHILDLLVEHQRISQDVWEYLKNFGLPGYKKEIVFVWFNALRTTLTTTINIQEGGQ